MCTKEPLIWVLYKNFELFTGKNHNIFGAMLVKMAISNFSLFWVICLCCLFSILMPHFFKIAHCLHDFPFIIHERRKQTYFIAFLLSSLILCIFSVFFFSFIHLLPSQLNNRIRNAQFAKKPTAQNRIDSTPVYGQERNGLVVRP